MGRGRYSTPSERIHTLAVFEDHDWHTPSDLADARSSASGRMLADFECRHGHMEEDCEECRK